MATSGTYVETRTASNIITAALESLAMIDPAESLSSEDEATGIKALNDIIYQVKGKINQFTPGLRMWQRETGLLTLDSTKNEYDLKPSGGQLDIQVPEEILTAVLRHTSSSVDRPLKFIALEQYQAISNKSAAGVPQRLYYEKQSDANGKLYTDCKPSASVASAYKISFVYRQPLEIIVAVANELDFPNHWYRALKYMLAVELAPVYECTNLTWNKVTTLAAQSLQLANAFEPEDTDVYFQPGLD